MYLYFFTHGKVLRFYELFFFLLCFLILMLNHSYGVSSKTKEKTENFLNFDEKIYILYIISNGNDG